MYIYIYIYVCVCLCIALTNKNAPYHKTGNETKRRLILGPKVARVHALRCAHIYKYVFGSVCMDIHMFICVPPSRTRVNPCWHLTGFNPKP